MRSIPSLPLGFFKYYFLKFHYAHKKWASYQEIIFYIHYTIFEAMVWTNTLITYSKMGKQYPQYINKIYKSTYTVLQLDPANSNTVI